MSVNGNKNGKKIWQGGFTVVFVGDGDCEEEILFTVTVSSHSMVSTCREIKTIRTIYEKIGTYRCVTNRGVDHLLS